MEALAQSPTESWTVELTRHCVERYRERFCPALDLVAAESRLEQVLDFARLEPHAPAWVVPNAKPTAAYLIVGDDLAVPLVETGSRSSVMVAVSCLARGGIPQSARERRNARRRRRGGRR